MRPEQLWTGELERTASRPDGAPRKVLDSRELATLGFLPRASSTEALTAIYRSYEGEIASHA
jgi:hypothetical protein